MTRELAYKDRFVSPDEQTLVTEECESAPLVLPLDETTTVLFSFTGQEFGEMLSSLWLGADLYYGDHSHQIVWNFLKAVDCPMDLCEVITACLAETFSGLNEKLDSLLEQVQQVADQSNAQQSSQTNVIDGATAESDCGGATAIVEQMNAKVEKIFADTEASLPDQILEALPLVLPVIISALGTPAAGLASLPFDSLLGLVEWRFENQVAEYRTDYDAARQDMIDDLACRVKINAHDFTFDIWSEWLDGLPALIPDNRAADVFSRFSFTHQSFLNQIAALINKNESLQTWFDELAIAYEGGVATGDDNCTECAFSCHSWDFTADEQGWTIQDSLGAYGDAGFGDEFHGTVQATTLELKIRYTFASAIAITSMDITSNHADMYVTIETNKGVRVDSDYHPFNGNPDTMTFDINQSGIEWLQIHLVRQVTDSYIGASAVFITYRGDVPADGTEC